MATEEEPEESYEEEFDEIGEDYGDEEFGSDTEADVRTPPAGIGDQHEDDLENSLFSNNEQAGVDAEDSLFTNNAENQPEVDDEAVTGQTNLTEERDGPSSDLPSTEPVDSLFTTPGPSQDPTDTIQGRDEVIPDQPVLEPEDPPFTNHDQDHRAEDGDEAGFHVAATKPEDSLFAGSAPQQDATDRIPGQNEAISDQASLEAVGSIDNPVGLAHGGGDASLHPAATLDSLFTEPDQSDNDLASYQPIMEPGDSMLTDHDLAEMSEGGVGAAADEQIGEPADLSPADFNSTEMPEGRRDEALEHRAGDSILAHQAHEDMTDGQHEPEDQAVIDPLSSLPAIHVSESPSDKPSPTSQTHLEPAVHQALPRSNVNRERSMTQIGAYLTMLYTAIRNKNQALAMTGNEELEDHDAAKNLCHDVPKMNAVGDFCKMPESGWKLLHSRFEHPAVSSTTGETAAGVDVSAEKPELELDLTRFPHEWSADELNRVLLKYEGIEGPRAQTARRRLRELIGTRKTETEVDRFLNRMREKGEGSITIAWRRYFDSDGDGELSFSEFVNALVDFEYQGVDVVKLWHAVGKGAKEIGLEMLDPLGAEILETFTNWCIREGGGPYEVFKMMDDDGSDSLEPHEFIEALEEMGWFDQPGLPATIADGESVLKNLYPLLDQSGLGCVQAEQVLFLEKDKEKRAGIAAEIARIKEFGHDAMLRPLSWFADEHLHKVYMEHTPLGGKHFKTLPKKEAQLACGAGLPPRKDPPRLGHDRETEPYRLAEPRTFWPSSPSKVHPIKPRAKQPLPKSKSVPSLKATPSAQQGAMFTPTASPALGSAGDLVGAADAGKETHSRRRLSGWAGGNQRLLVHGGTLGAGKPNFNHGPGLDPRSIYKRSLIPPLPPLEDYTVAKGAALQLLPKPKKKLKKDVDFHPHTAVTDEFFVSRKLRNVYNHYDSISSMDWSRH